MKKNLPSSSDMLSTNKLLEKINTIGIEACDAVSIDNLLTSSLRHILDIFNANRGSIYLINDAQKELSLKVSFGTTNSDQKKIIKNLGEGIVGKVAEIKKPIYVKDISKDSRFTNYKSRKSYQTASFICAPLIIKDTLIGVINISDKKSGESFNHQDLELIDFLSNQIALNHQRVHLNQSLANLIKESKNLSEETTQLKIQVTAQERFASIGKLAGGIAHEFNNPLDGVMRYTNLAIDHLQEDDAVVKEYLLEVRHGLKRMANIVKSLLACARNTHPAINKININLSVENVIKEFHSNLFKKNISLEKHLSKNIPEVMDFGIDRIFSNLMSNAIDAMPEHGKISISTSADRGFLIILFTDSGTGIPKEYADKIFEPFFTTKNIDQGCGLGLTIVSEIVKSYKGDIGIESSPNKGTTFTIRLPIES